MVSGSRPEVGNGGFWLAILNVWGELGVLVYVPICQIAFPVDLLSQ
jgi:hypothetical protein